MGAVTSEATVGSGGGDRAPLPRDPRGDGARRARRRDRRAAPSTPASTAASSTCRASRSCTATRTCCCRSRATRRSSSRARRRYVGEHGTTWIDEQVFVDRPGEWLADRVRGKRVGVFGLDYVMPVRDFTRARRRRPSSSRGTSRSTTRGPSRATSSSTRSATASASTPRASGVPRGSSRPGRTEREMLAPLRGVFVARGLRPQDDGHGARRRERLRAAGVQGRGRAAVRRDRHGAAVARGRRPRRPLGRGLARDLPRRAERRVARR